MFKGTAGPGTQEFHRTVGHGESVAGNFGMGDRSARRTIRIGRKETISKWSRPWETGT